ncbi:hypothetical protein [Halocalculus aciditolerans]|uniref:Uncharacterized protein n=1 Tax=Halocalculus aciditolerans TaxID=1383812 RepID=A0A830FB67_9EURY|nr:hypothetical protein [Halocalculus aciditolerans]GGL72450.1 hypothetical protein GCM10009039_33020 [Halocalculus aciditolerans]
MDVLADMATITEENAGGTLRYFVGATPDDRDVERLYLRDDVEWNANRDREIESELDSLVAVDTYETLMSAENINQIIKVADDKILFTGFVGDKVAIAAFDRGVFPHLDDIVSEFRAYMEEHDIEFIALDA